MSGKILNHIKSRSAELLQKVIEYRHHLHRNPELSFHEEETSTWICNVLDSHGIPYTTGWAGYGVVGEISGKDSNKVVALRADMDALPITEENEKPYRSEKEGVMHACGHDVHMASLLGTAIILNEMKEELPHSIRLIFQPGEEKLPGGASVMIGEGVLRNPEPVCILGQHVYPVMEAGRTGVRAGLYMASADELYITVKGKGGHAAAPQRCTDTILAASQIVVNLQQVICRMTDPIVNAVLTIGKFNSIGGATNVIPDEVSLEGTFRCMDENWRQKAHTMITDVAEKTAAVYGATCEVRIMHGYPSLVNNPALAQNVRQLMEQYLGEDRVEELPMKMSSEDFAFYSQVIPACFYRLGTGNKAANITANVHTSTFDIDESALETGMGMMAWLALNQ